MKKPLLFLAVVSTLTFGTAQTTTFSYTGDFDSIQIPNCVDSVLINVWGAQGENAAIGGTGGLGAFASAKKNVSPGDWIYVNVGGQNGYNGGGIGGKNGYTDFSGTIDPGYGGYGGGASDIRVGGYSLADRLIVAGGGGGGGHNGVWPGCQPAAPAGNGGEGSGVDGGTGSSFDCGCSGDGGIGGITATISAGGAGGNTNGFVCGSSGTLGGSGTLGVGGAGHTNIDYGDGGAGGGGGGYYGGGAGGNGYNTTPGGGGGGGSSFIDATLVSPNVVAGLRSGNGQVTITFILSAPIMTNLVSQTDITLNALQAAVAYQWLDCGAAYAPIVGATSQSFVATSNGSYAVQLNNGNGCVDTSLCHTITEVGISENNQSLVRVYPNPASQNIQVDLQTESENVLVQIFDMEGRLVFETAKSTSTFTLNIEVLNSGVYLMQVNADGNLISKIQLVKE